MINSWNIKTNTHNIFNNSLTDKQTINNINNLNKLEQFVYNIAQFHFNRLNKKYDNTKHSIEYWSSTNTNQEFILNTKTLLSCITYLDKEEPNIQTITPTILTNITDEMYKYKNLPEIKLYYSFPQFLKHVVIDNDTYYYNNRNSLMIQIVEKEMQVKSNNIFYISPTEKQDNKVTITIDDTNELEFEPIKNITVIGLNKQDFDTNFYEKIIYNINQTEITKLTNLIQNQIHMQDKSYTFLFQNNTDNKQLIDSMPTQDNTVAPVQENKEQVPIQLNNKKEIDISISKFIQRFIVKKYYQPEICNWIINESEIYATNNGGWLTTRHDNYPTTDLPIDKIPTIFSFILTTFAKNIDIIKKSYCITNSTIFNIEDIFIIKYDINSQNELELHSDQSSITINMLLSNTSDFEGGGTYFEDGITTYLEQGDMIIHNGHVKHSGLKITNGKRYVLVAFIKLYDQ